jgi:amino acid transporter
MSTIEAARPTTARSPSASGHGLKSRALGFPTLLAQSVALISPTMTAVLIIPICFADSGQGTWLAYAFGTVMLLFVVFCLNQFAKRSAMPGSMYGYTAKGLGPRAGVMSGWALIWCYTFIGIAGLTGFSIFAAQLVGSMGIHTTIPPVIYFCLSAALCWFVAFKDIKISSLLTLAFEGASVACILALAAVILFKHGFPSDPTQLKAHGMTLHDLSLAVVITVFSLVGFESATTLGGEARKPLVAIPRAVIASLLITGAFMVIMSYVEVFGAAHTHISLSSLSAPLTFLSKAYGVGFFKVPVALGAMVSFFSLTLSCLNAGARIIYPMAQHTVFPKQFAKSHPKNKTPHVAISCYILIILTVPCVLEIFTNPLTTFGDGGTLAAFGFLTAYWMITIAAPVYLKKIGELKPWNVVITVIAGLALSVPTIGSFVPVPPYPIRLFPYIFFAWMLIGGSWLMVLSRRDKTIFTAIETDLETTMAASVAGHAEDMGMGSIVTIEELPMTGMTEGRSLAPTFEELDMALEGAS